MADPRLDPEMAAFNAMMEARAAALPPIRLAAALRRAAGADRGAEPAAGRRRAGHGRERRPLGAGARPPGAVPGAPAGPARARCRVLLYLHGGGWVWNSIDTHDRLMREYAAAAGCIVVGPDYALSPEAVFPQALEECEAVLRWIAAAGRRLGARPDAHRGRRRFGRRQPRGGPRALAARRPGAPLPLRGLLLNYGVFDSRLDTPSYAEFATGYGLTRERMEFYWRVYAPRAADRVSPFAAPLRGDLAGLPPCLLHIAELDVLASENHAMAARLQAAGVRGGDAALPRHGAWLPPRGRPCGPGAGGGEAGRGLAARPLRLRSPSGVFDGFCNIQPVLRSAMRGAQIEHRARR